MEGRGESLALSTLLFFATNSDALDVFIALNACCLKISDHIAASLRLFAISMSPKNSSYRNNAMRRIVCWTKMYMRNAAPNL